ncbi:MAG: hypothetical protein KAS32_14365 [Candidatus Peribacteraceae bacterium]|nr:hypothetical protein [Candidatus Peribacteraceae bacterium]
MKYRITQRTRLIYDKTWTRMPLKTMQGERVRFPELDNPVGLLLYRWVSANTNCCMIWEFTGQRKDSGQYVIHTYEVNYDCNTEKAFFDLMSSGITIEELKVFNEL